MSVQFAFPPSSLNNRFRQVPKKSVESLVAQALSEVCNAQLRPWRCTPGTNTPGLQFELYRDDHDGYSIRVTLSHSGVIPGLQDSWSAQLYSSEDLGSIALPVDRDWVGPIRDLVQEMLRGPEMSKSVLNTLSEVVPLGTDVAMIPTEQSPRSSAVLPLAWNDYKEFATWKYRLVYQGDAGQITIHSGGVGKNSAFKPGAEVFQGLLVINEEYQLGSLKREAIDAHLQELGSLVPVAFYVESFAPAPVDLSIAH